MIALLIAAAVLEAGAHHGVAQYVEPGVLSASATLNSGDEQIYFSNLTVSDILQTGILIELFAQYGFPFFYFVDLASLDPKELEVLLRKFHVEIEKSEIEPIWLPDLQTP